MILEIVKTEHSPLDISSACQLVGTSRTWFNAWLKKPATLEAKFDPLYEPIHALKKENRKYGYRRVYHALKETEHKAGKKKIIKSMRKHDFLCKKRKFTVHTTNSNHGLRTYPNLIKNLVVVGLNKVWTADITYIRLANGTTVYLSVIMDRFSRKFLGWQLSYNIDTQLCLDALHMALKEREGADLSDLIHHSDQGVQYASNEYIAELEKRGIKISMSRKGNPYDNAHMESAIKTIKYEEVYMDEYQSFSDAFNNIKHFIEEVYNKKRLHSGIGYKPPTEFEQQYKLKEVVT